MTIILRDNYRKTKHISNRSQKNDQVSKRNNVPMPVYGGYMQSASNNAIINNSNLYYPNLPTGFSFPSSSPMFQPRLVGYSSHVGYFSLTLFITAYILLTRKINSKHVYVIYHNNNNYILLHVYLYIDLCLLQVPFGNLGEDSTNNVNTFYPNWSPQGHYSDAPMNMDGISSFPLRL